MTSISRFDANVAAMSCGANSATVGNETSFSFLFTCLLTHTFPLPLLVGIYSKLREFTPRGKTPSLRYRLF